MKKAVVAVTGAAGNIGYSLVFRIASGEMLGPDTRIELRLLEVEPALPVLNGVMMELNDCAFPLLDKVSATSDPAEGFRDANWIILVGAAPRKKGMERGDLLKINGEIFHVQGKAINDNAAKDVRVLVVGNPCNTNAFIAHKNAPDIPSDRWFAMTELDETRARYQLANKAGVAITEVTDMSIWGNHSATQYPDFYNARIGGKPVTEVIKDEDWLKNDFISTVQKRGAAIIEARGASSAASAASAAIRTIQNLTRETPKGEWYSTAIVSDGSYGVEKGMVFSYPMRTVNGKNEIVQGLELNDFAKKKIDATLKELHEEREAVKDFIG